MKNWRIGDKVRVKEIESDKYPEVYYAKISFIDNEEKMVDVYWYNKYDKRSYSTTHAYRITDLIQFGPRRSGHHLTNIFK